MTQDLLRAAMTQRLFPRLIDDDPLREDDWFPDTEMLVMSILPESAIKAMREAREES
jgi:hypothetical protein